MASSSSRSVRGTPSQDFERFNSLSLADPHPNTVKSDDNLQKFLESVSWIPTQEDRAFRKQIIARLDQIVKRWVNDVAISRRHVGKPRNAKILPFGSYSLEVWGPEGDIDVLCIGPYYATKMDFFSTLYTMLANMPDVQEIKAIQDAVVPLIKFRFNGIFIDLSYGRLTLSIIPEDLDISQENVCAGADAETIKCMRGWRFTNQILQVVPALENFRITLRYIKFWAKSRGIYSHMVGFLGGVHWSLLVTYICKIFPDSFPSMLVSKFFHIYANWQWPDPIMLFPVKANLSIQYRNHVMPIISPVYPHMNLSYNVTENTLGIMKEELRRGDNVFKSCQMDRMDWRYLSEKFPSFQKFLSFVCINLTAVDNNDLGSWKGFVESRFWQLIQKIEMLLHGKLQCRPNPHGFVDDSVAQPQCTFYWGLCHKEGLPLNNLTVDVALVGNMFRRVVLEGSSGRPGRKITVSYVCHDQIPYYCLASG